jgi:SpoVK/Ycf46/Vps4 family AAA+-type ATPase
MVTVNNINNLDKAIIRPGRFDDIIEFSLPNKKERYSFIKEYLMKLGSTIQEEDCQVFSELTEGMTQAYLKEYCLQFVIEQNTTMLFSKIEKRKKYLGVTPVSGEINSESTFSLVDLIVGSEEDEYDGEDD